MPLVDSLGSAPRPPEGPHESPKNTLVQPTESEERTHPGPVEPETSHSGAEAYDPEGGEAYDPEGGEAIDPEGGDAYEQEVHPPSRSPVAIQRSPEKTQRPAELDDPYAPSVGSTGAETRLSLPRQESPIQDRHDIYESERFGTEAAESQEEKSQAASTQSQPVYTPYEPSSYQPSSHQPSSHQPSSHQASSYQPTTFQPTTYEPTTYQPSTKPAPSDVSTDKQQVHGLGLRSMGSAVPYQPESDDPYAPSGSSEKPASMYAKTSYQPGEQPNSTSSYEPYAPTSQSSLLAPADAYGRSQLGSSYGSDLGISPPQPSYFQAMPPPDPTYVPQQVLEQKPIAEDPLGRSTLAARNAPLAVFGFGGVLITAFPGSADSDTPTGGHHRTPSYGYASGRGQLWIRTVSELASTSALKPNDNVFPGPLILDPSTPKGAAGEKKKREAVGAYLRARVEEIEQGLPYLKTSASQARREEEGKLVLVKLLAALVTGDGKLTGR